MYGFMRFGTMYGYMCKNASMCLIQALAQCDNYLRRMGVVKEVFDDTAGAAQVVASRQLQGVGAVCSRRAAELYGLDVLEEVRRTLRSVSTFLFCMFQPGIRFQRLLQALGPRGSVGFSMSRAASCDRYDLGVV